MLYKILLPFFVAVMAVTPRLLVAEMPAFSVRDSIQMTRFNEQLQTTDGQGQRLLVNTSPNGKYGVLLTSRGIIESNQVESTLWLIDIRDVQMSLEKSEDGFLSPPRVLAVVKAQPAIDSRGVGVYGAVISNIRWSNDSQSIYFLGENSRAERQLYSVNVTRGLLHRLTPDGQDVESFDVGHGTLIYLAASSTDTNGQVSPGTSINSEAHVITDSPIDVITNSPAYRLRTYNLWYIHNNRHCLAFRTATTIQATAYVLARPLQLSPDGKSVIMLIRAKDIQQSWEKYEAPPSFRIMQLDHSDLRPIAPFSPTPLREYVIVNLLSGKATLVGALDARYFNYPGAGSAAWSSTNDSVLLTNVFLPLQGVKPEESANRIHPCEAAVYQATTQKLDCLKFSVSGLTPNGDHLQGGSFDSTGMQAILRYGGYGQSPSLVERYIYSGTGWKPAEYTTSPLSPNVSSQSPSVVFSIHESLNDRPVLWAENLATKASKKIWDPNPQLDKIRIGVVSAYHWKDTNGNQWTGGLFKPVGYEEGKRYPLVIQTHGFDKDKFITDGSYPTAMAARALASDGIMVLQIGGGSDASHVESLAESQDNVQAYESAIDSLSTVGLIDARKVGIVGFSRTSWYVENALEKDSARYTAATIADGVNYSYMQYLLFGPSSVQWQHDFEKLLGGAPTGKQLESWARFSPGFRTNLIDTPLRIEALQPVSVLLEWELYSSLKMQGKPVDLIYYPKGQHILQEPLERLASQQGDVDWFRFWLQGYERPNPEDSDQYVRWRKLRKQQEENDKKGKEDGQPGTDTAKPK